MTRGVVCSVHRWGVTRSIVHHVQQVKPKSWLAGCAQVGFSAFIRQTNWSGRHARVFFKTFLVPFIALAALHLETSARTAPPPPEVKPGLERIGHIIVIYLENRSFDHLYGLFPGADGLSNAAGATGQVTSDGRRFDVLPAVLNNYEPSWIDTRFAEELPNEPFREDHFVDLREQTGDPVHRFYQEREQINGGKMDRFVAFSGVGGLPMGYFDGHELPLFKLAEQYTLADHFFHAAFGGGFLNHMWLICACTPRYENAPAELLAQLDANGQMTRDGSVTPDGLRCQHCPTQVRTS